MRYSFNGKNTTISDKLKERVTSKLGKLEKLLPENTEVIVSISTIKLDNKIEVTIPIHKRVLRAEVVSDDMYNAIDEIVDKLDRQVIKFKGRLKDKSRRDTSYKEEYKVIFSEPDDTHAAGDEIKIEKIKRFALKPMDAEEAVMEMELTGHTFFVFRNSTTDDVNVVYKRGNGSYGLIEPEY